MKKKTDLTKVQKKVRKAPLGSGLLKKTSKSIQKRQKKQEEILRKMGY